MFITFLPAEQIGNDLHKHHGDNFDDEGGHKSNLATDSPLAAELKDKYTKD
jgi:hypothetical protein